MGVYWRFMQDEINEAIAALLKLKDLTLGIEKSNMEINMWRGRFLVSIGTEKITTDDCLLCNCFHSIPSLEFIKQSPEKHIEDIKKYIYENR